MPRIELETFIAAPFERCFDLSRSIDLHQSSVAQTNEVAVAGVTSGLISNGDEVTWRAQHFGVVQELTVRIDRFDPPHHFRDSMLRGAFRYLRHDHFFTAANNGCLMRDVFDYASPLGIFGHIADRLFLENYMRQLLIGRNAIIKRVAETDDWKTLLPS